MARRQKEERRAGIASRGMVRRLSHCSSRVRHRDIPDAIGCLIGATPRGSVMDVCSDAPARAQRLSTRRMAVLCTFRGPFSVSPRAPRIHAHRVARFEPYNTRNCLSPKNLRREIQ